MMNPDLLSFQGDSVQMTEDYQVFEWYAAQMDLTVDYLLDEFFIDGNLILPKELVDYDYECATS